jgi:hypothetical protein
LHDLARNIENMIGGLSEPAPEHIAMNVCDWRTKAAMEVATAAKDEKSTVGLARWFERVARLTIDCS